MANVIGNGTISQIADIDGDPITSSNRFPVETEQDDAFSTWSSYAAFEVRTDSQNLTHADHASAEIVDAKEVIIQTDDANTSYVMVGSSAILTVAHGTPSSRKGIKLNGGETLVLAWATFASVFLIGSTSNQYVNVAYFK